MGSTMAAGRGAAAAAAQRDRVRGSRGNSLSMKTGTVLCHVPEQHKDIEKQMNGQEAAWPYCVGDSNARPANKSKRDSM